MYHLKSLSSTSVCLTAHVSAYDAAKATQPKSSKFNIHNFKYYEKIIINVFYAISNAIKRN